MRSVNTDPAAARNVEDWDQIPWPKLHDNVRRLQIRIAKATREQNWRRVKALQRFLVNSFSAKALAVKRVSENDGKRTPGVDGEKWTTPGAKWQAIQRLGSRGLRPQPLRRVYIPKRGSTKMRPLGIPTMIIRAQQALHLQGLEPVAKTRADPNSYGFRRNRGTRDAIEVKPLVETFLAERGLQLSPTKTTITHISEGFDFLGQNVRKYDGKLLIKPSAKNVKAFLGKVRETIRGNCSTTQETLINLLNPMIRGWANYHRHVVAKTMYSKVDHHIWQALWRWARRRHPNKSKGWVQRRYFRTIGPRRWVFATDTLGRDGEAKVSKLYLAKETRIIRHVKVKSKANPFDPAWNSYFAQRDVG
jgi:retron-type reverse transcriptase